MWYLATITSGIPIPGFETGHHCYVNRTITGKVRVIGKAGITAIVALDEARRRVRVKRYQDGRPVAVRDQVRQESRWSERREARRFDGRPCMAA